MAELQKDPMTRGDFLGFGLMGAIMGAILTIPPVAFIVTPIIKTDVLGQSDVTDDWQEVGSVSEIPEDEPKVFVVEFPLNQTYGIRSIQEESGVTDKKFTLRNAVWLSWKHEVVKEGRQGSAGDELGEGMRPAFMDQKSEGFTEEERQELLNSINVLSNSCAHLGCPVRWLVNTEGHGEFLCPCHGGIYDINGGWVGGPPPRGMYRYTQVKIEEDGKLYVKHEYDIGGDKGPQRPYVV
ncbi:MAG: ubiquinol-cytochrome c reductase iron-sulfur subunit [Actinobacteria bacterium]|nr:ubiquinol-cytochrome c reductase iron-sulfur subunit [Actinomycetota bacterium]